MNNAGTVKTMETLEVGQCILQNELAIGWVWWHTLSVLGKIAQELEVTLDYTVSSRPTRVT